jgi:hypothetical protein
MMIRTKSWCQAALACLTLAGMITSAAPINAQPTAPLVLRPEPGWPAMQVLEPRSGGRYSGSDAHAVPVFVKVHRGQISRRDFRLAVTIDGRRYIVTDPRGFYLQDLAQGTHTVKIELLDYRGEIVPGGTSVQERTFTTGPRKHRSRSKSTTTHRTISARSYNTDAEDTVSRVSTGGFTVRTGGRREGPAPRPDATPVPQIRVSSTDSADRAPSSESNANMVPIPSAPPATADPDASDSPASRSSDDGSTVSTAMRQRLLETGARLRNGSRPAETQEQNRVVVRSRDEKTTPPLTADESEETTR